MARRKRTRFILGPEGEQNEERTRGKKKPTHGSDTLRRKEKGGAKVPEKGAGMGNSVSILCSGRLQGRGEKKGRVGTTHKKNRKKKKKEPNQLRLSPPAGEKEKKTGGKGPKLDDPLSKKEGGEKEKKKGEEKKRKKKGRHGT